MWNHQVSKSRAHSENFEPAVGISPITGRTTDVETDKGYKYLGNLQTSEKMQSQIVDESQQTHI